MTINSSSVTINSSSGFEIPLTVGGPSIGFTHLMVLQCVLVTSHTNSNTSAFAFITQRNAHTGVRQQSHRYSLGLSQSVEGVCSTRLVTNYTQQAGRVQHCSSGG
jgi:hypothetical protein